MYIKYLIFNDDSVVQYDIGCYDVRFAIIDSIAQPLIGFFIFWRILFLVHKIALSLDQS